MLVVLPSLLLLLLVYTIYRLPSTFSARHPAWTYSRSTYGIEVSTTALNSVPVQLVGRLSASQAHAFKAFYNVGVIISLLGVVASTAFVFVEWARAWTLVWLEAEEHARTQAVVDHVRVRHVLGSAPTAPDTSFQLLIPGVTAPLSHLPTLLLATLLAQLVHESAHALAAALDDLAPARITFGFFLCFPQATVGFSSAADHLPRGARKRIAASGPWHNAACWLMLLAVRHIGLGRLIQADVDGRVVQAVRYASPLYPFLAEGGVVTHLDDLPVTGEDDVWGRYLQSDEVADIERGWCVPEAAFMGSPMPSCTTPLIAFRLVAAAYTSDDHCLVPHPLLTAPAVPTCNAAGQVLVRPAPAEQVLRIRLQNGEVLMFSGDRQAVFDDVKVGFTAPVVLAGFFRWLALFHEYLAMASLSLFLFNLIPLPATDGIQLVASFLPDPARRHHVEASRHPSAAYEMDSPPARRSARQDYGWTTAGTGRAVPVNANARRRWDDEGEESDDEYGEGEGAGEGAGGGGSRREGVWQRRVRRAIEGVVSATVAGWIGGWAMVALLRSS